MMNSKFKKLVGASRTYGTPLLLIFYSIGLILLFITFACNQKTTNGKTLVVDVRPEGIWKQGHASIGKNIPLTELEKHKAELLKYDTVIFVCETGQSAQQATSYMNTLKDHTTIFKNGVSWTRYN